MGKLVTVEAWSLTDQFRHYIVTGKVTGNNVHREATFLSADNFKRHYAVRFHAARTVIHRSRLPLVYFAVTTLFAASRRDTERERERIAMQVS